jgi:hypothetical protein
MSPEANPDLHQERGSALILAMLTSVILALLGIAYLLMAATENQIAENELLSAQVLYYGEAVARQVKIWFDAPYGAENLRNPPEDAIDLTLRLIDDDGDPSTAPHLQDGGTWPRYKQGVDLDADGMDDLFERPYRGNLTDTLLGTEDGPDMRIDEWDPEGQAFLADLSEALLTGFPNEAAGMRVRIRRIDIYAPPTLEVGGIWTRYGMATVKVIARVVRQTSSGEQVAAQRVVKAVLNEVPYSSGGSFGPLHSCLDLSVNGDFTVHWGKASAVRASDLSNNHKKYAASLARDIPISAAVDSLLYTNDDPGWANYKAAIDGEVIEDPWFYYLGGRDLADAPTSDPQPWPFPGLPLASGGWPNHEHGPDDGCHSNVFQNMPIVTCPSFPYDVWKSIATGGGRDVHYFVWQDGSTFKENGVGPALTFRQITDNRTGLFFFDTRDQLEPRDDNGDGWSDNLTPQIQISGGTYGIRGFVYLNAESFRTTGNPMGRAVAFQAPGEPYQDKNSDGQWGAGDGDWINLDYPSTVSGSIVAVSGATDDDPGGVPSRNDRGPVVDGDALLWGILYTNGFFDATGNANYYGSVITKKGVGQSNPSAGTPNLYWDESIRTEWPPEGWGLPRVVITRWATDL